MTSANHSPLNGAGADSVDPAWNPTPWSVLMEHRWMEGDRIRVRIPSAIGPHDAKSQAAHKAPEYVALMAEPEEVAA
jgi:hypothetical protein